MLSWRLFFLFIHVASVIVALGGSLFSTFALTPILNQELEPPMRVRISLRVIRRLGVIVLGALAVLVVTGVMNVYFLGVITEMLVVKLVIVAAVIVLALYQYAGIGGRIQELAADGPAPALAGLQARFRRVGLTVGALVLIIVYISIGLTRGGAGPILYTLP